MKFMYKHNNFLPNNIGLVVIGINNIIIVMLSCVLYYVYPRLLNFPNGLIESGYLEKWGYPYTIVFITVVVLIILFISFFLWLNLRKLNKWPLSQKNPIQKEKIRKKCLNLPYFIYLTFLLLPLLILIFSFILITIFYKQSFSELMIIVNSKQILSLFSFLTMLGIISFIATKNIFKYILIKTYTNEKLEGIRINLNLKIFLQLIPLIIVAILITALLGYSHLITEKGDLLYQINKTKLMQKLSQIDFIIDFDSIIKHMDQLNLDDASYFIISPDEKIFTSDQQDLDFWFLNYLKDIAPSQDGLFTSSTWNRLGIKMP